MFQVLLTTYYILAQNQSQILDLFSLNNLLLYDYYYYFGALQY